MNSDKSKIIKNINLQKLTPAICDKMDYYEQALDFVFSEDDILNIAITGAYSSGKSSVIKTYEKLHTNKRYTYISLANFGDVEEGTKQENEKEANLEWKIINQFIHQIDYRKIPQTRFKIKFNINKWQILINILLLEILISSIIYIINFNKWSINIDGIYNNILKTILIKVRSEEFLVFLILISVTLTTNYVYKFIKSQYQKPILKKIKFSNNEIELSEKQEESYFDRYLDEIIYLFLNSQSDVIIFEDIDRYNNRDIFSKLREINFLLNKKSKTPIRFLYLLRDDIFNSKDRTKFFDFIIPIVPVIDSSNSYDKLLEYLGAEQINKFDNIFLERVCLYIDDLRLLKNIYNEYIIYNGRIQGTELNRNKLLAIIIYKNIFPTDFSNLQLNSGFVYDIFYNKKDLIRRIKDSIDMQIKNNLNLVEATRKEHLNNLDELDALYLTSGLYNLRVDNKYDNNYGNRIEYVKKMKTNNANIEMVSKDGYYNTYTKIDLQDKLDEFNKNEEYVRRKQILELKMNDEISKIKNENKNLENEKMKLDNLEFHKFNKKNIEEIFTNKNLNNSTKYKNIKDNLYYPLIKYLLRNGYIDETYTDYLTYFYENRLKTADKIFLRSITDEISKEYTYKLIDINNIIGRLKFTDFNKEEILNFDLLNFLLDNKHKYLKNMLQKVIADKNFNFIFSYLSGLNERYNSIFIQELNIEWGSVFKELLDSRKITKEEKVMYIRYTIMYSKVDRVVEMDIDNCLSNFISNEKEFLNYYYSDDEKLIEILNKIKVKFKRINFNDSYNKLFYKVYENNLYELNFYMINLVLKNIYKIPESLDYFQKNYTLICSSDSTLKRYVNSNINEYIAEMIGNSNNVIIDSEKDAIDILNNENLNREYKLDYICKLEINISNLREIKDVELWRDIVKRNLLKSSAYNVFTYFDEFQVINSTILSFLNDNIIDFNYDYLKEVFDEKTTLNFLKKIIYIEDEFLEDEVYKRILKECNYHIEKFNDSSIKNEKMKILIELNIISMTKENILFLRLNYPNLNIEFITNKIEEYLNCLSDEMYEENEILELLKKEDIDNIQKINIITKTPYNISIFNNNYEEDLLIAILKNKFDVNELNQLINCYDKKSHKIQLAIEEICIDNIGNICKNKYKFTYKLMISIISRDIDINYRRDIVYSNLNLLNSTNIINILEKVELDYFVKLFSGRKPKILVSQENEKVLFYLKKIELISNFSVNQKNSMYYSIRGAKLLNSNIS